MLFSKKNLLLILYISLYLVSLVGQEQQNDTSRVYTIPEITVTDKQHHNSIKSTTPLQVLTSSDLKQLNALQMSDAIKHFTGVTVKDYGGIGGLKTLSVRSLGANHTAVSYDGIVVSDIQSGQIDIGKFSLDNVMNVSLNSGQSDNIFQSAKAFASASVLTIKTQKPLFEENRIINGKAKLKAGSFGLFNPSINLDGKINEKLSANLNAEYLYANGEYPFKLYYGNNHEDNWTTERRKNTDVANVRIEGTIFSDFSNKRSGYIKSYYYQSERGLPGGIIWYNPNQNTQQRAWDKTFFTQAHYKNEANSKIHFQVNGKYNWNWMRYLDSGTLSSVKAEESIYSQNEYYVSSSLLYNTFDRLSFSLSADGFINELSSENITPKRYSLLSVLAIKYADKRISATANILNTLIKESANDDTKPKNHRQFSPYVGLSIKPFHAHDFRIRTFYKNIFRLPTFNDLYYFNVGNRNLKPETTNQLNLGVTYNTSLEKYIPHFTITLDAYHNNIDNKIIAQPTKDIFVWRMINFGKVSINGIDVNLDTKISATNKVNLTFGSSYSYQRALNITDPNSKRDYRHQIPYTPRISGSGKAGIETPWINLFYSVIWSGHRYTLTQNYAENRLAGYTDHSISASRDFEMSFGKFSGSIEILNFTNKNYEVVRGFPMPGQSLRGTITFTF